MRKISGLDVFVLIFTIIGGLNIGLHAVLGVDLINALLGEFSIFSRILEGVIGISALYLLLTLLSLRRK